MLNRFPLRVENGRLELDDDGGVHAVNSMRCTVILSRRRRWSAKRGTPQDGRRTPNLLTRTCGGFPRSRSASADSRHPSGLSAGGPSTVLRSPASPPKLRRLRMTISLLGHVRLRDSIADSAFSGDDEDHLGEV